MRIRNILNNARQTIMSAFCKSTETEEDPFVEIYKEYDDNGISFKEILNNLDRKYSTRQLEFEDSEIRHLVDLAE